MDPKHLYSVGACLHLLVSDAKILKALPIACAENERVNILYNLYTLVYTRVLSGIDECVFGALVISPLLMPLTSVNCDPHGCCRGNGDRFRAIVRSKEGEASSMPVAKPKPKVPITLPPPGFVPTMVAPKVTPVHAKPGAGPAVPLVIVDETSDEEG